MAGTRGAGQAALREAAGGEEEKAGGAEGQRGQETRCRGGEEEAEAGRGQGPTAVAPFTVSQSLLIEFSGITSSRLSEHLFLWLKARHEAAMRRTVDRSQRAKQKPNRWSWGGSLQPGTPSTAAGTFTPPPQ